MAFYGYPITPSTTPDNYERLFPLQQGSRKFPLPHIDKAIKINNLALVDFFFTKAPQLLNIHDESNKTFLGKGIAAGHLPLAERLIVLGADVNIPSAIGTDKTKISLLIHTISLFHHRFAWTRLLCYYGYSLNSDQFSDEFYQYARPLLKKVFRSLYIEIISFQRALKDHSPLPDPVIQIPVSYLWQPAYDCRNFTDDIATSVLAKYIHDQTTPNAFEEMRSLLPQHKFADTDDRGNTVLDHAIRKNNLPLIKYILSKEPQLLRRPVGKNIVPLFLIALGRDMGATRRITKMDLTARSYTYLLLREGCDADLTDSHELPYRALAELGMTAAKTPRFGRKWQKTHAFLKMVFAELGQEFARERTSLLTLLETLPLLIPEDKYSIVVDYVYPKNWDHIPGATSYLK